MKRFFIFGFIVLLFGGCQRDDVLPGDPKSLLGDWVLVSPKTAYTITLQIKPNTNFYPTNIIPPLMVSGKGPVNQYNSVLNYAPDGAKPEERRLRIDSPFTTTMKAENAEQRAVASDYLKRLNSVHSYELTRNGQLRLHHYSSSRPAEQTVLIYQRQ